MEERIEILEKFCMKLELSRYPVSVAGNIVRNGFLNFMRRVDKEILGAGRLHRLAEQGRSLRRRKKVCGKTS